MNALLDMDEKRDDAALGMDEEVTDSDFLRRNVRLSGVQTA